MIKHYDLFAGIGGFSYALDTVFNNEKIEHIFCEWEAFPTAILKKHWPDGTYYGDIADLVTDTASERLQDSRNNPKGRFTKFNETHENETQTILTGGFPCQPFSHAGRRKGTADDRYKWPEMFEVIRNVKPDWVIAENVRGFVTWNDSMVLERTCTDLESEGYEVQPFIIPACAVQAPHQRERVWIIAKRYDHAEPSNTDRFATNAYRRRWNTQSRDCSISERKENNDNALASDTNDSDTRLGFSGWEKDWREVALTTCYDGVDDGLSYRLHGATSRGKRTDVISASQHRKERLKACGNAIVPQVAMEIFRSIKLC